MAAHEHQVADVDRVATLDLLGHPPTLDDVLDLG
jgi:hypothetical protein